MVPINNASSIGVISDTHIPSRARTLPEKVLDVFSRCDAIIHCGDVVSGEVLIELEAIAPLYGVRGNMDNDNIGLPSDLALKINDRFTLFVWHGSQSHFGLKERIYSRALQSLKSPPYMLIHGHSHIAEISRYNDSIVFNPGSATNGQEFNSVGLLHINKDEIIPEIIRI